MGHEAAAIGQLVDRQTTQLEAPRAVGVGREGGIRLPDKAGLSRIGPGAGSHLGRQVHEGRDARARGPREFGNDRAKRWPAARGLLRAKTGSLKSVTALSGTVMDAEGRQLVFAVIADDTGAIGQYAPRQAIDAFATTLAGCGCQ